MGQQCVMNIHKSSAYLEEEIIKLKREIELLKEKIANDCDKNKSK